MDDNRITTTGERFTVPKLSKDGILISIFLSFLATAGLFYVNLGGAFLSAFVDGLGISRETAGYISSANKYGAAFGALIATFTVKHLPWRNTAYIALIILISVDLLCFRLTDPQTLIMVRFFHGTVGGFLVGLGFSIIARTASPDKVFGMLVAIQYTFGSVAIFTVPKLVGAMGPGAAFGALITFSSLTLLMVPFIPDYAASINAKADSAITAKVTPTSIAIVPAALALLALFLFQASNMSVADYAIELGKDSGYSIEYLSNILTLSNMISIFGALLVYFIGTKYGRALPIALGALVSGLFTFMFHWSDIPANYFIANTVTGIMWAFTVPYILGLCATFDSRGQVVVFAGFISKMGLASGPLIAAMVVGEGNFTLIINLAAIGLVVCAIAAFFPAKRSEKVVLDN
ncbi:MAG: MFS transporter [Porticoccaceae bacterium]|nr:MFS transporter [Porticoccaceae bacterium]|tara:strand:+ start:5764 stop:6978 length:1215 start_codon:yes stop_codon:yes gene_type:complete